MLLVLLFVLKMPYFSSQSKYEIWGIARTEVKQGELK